MRILFFGSDKFSAVILSELYKNLSRPSSSPSVYPIKHLEVVTPSGRPPAGIHPPPSFNPVLHYSNKHNLKYHFWDKKETRKMILSKKYFDIGVVAAFGYYIPSEMIDSFPNGIINMHGSLIPKLRGAAPIENAILDGETTTGLTIMEISKGKFDHGRVLSQETIKIPRNMTSNELRLHMAEIGRNLLMDTLANLDYKKQNPISIDEKLSSKAPKINNSTGKIDFNKCKCQQLHNMQRALNDRSGVWCKSGSKRVKLYNIISPLDSSIVSRLQVAFPGAELGSVCYIKENSLLGLKLVDGWAGIGDLHIEYRTKISAFEFHKNYLINSTFVRKFS
ncbi:Methionyl-tRNA formyltransferase, mitochondrial-like [Oopsacas minuta]|uniref:methionyl-tRNA formyltransferase n=1 Tax=Oopsacas minuta TaxID=111878 RepID=A0AAV7K761_9METZ|nr:Methionyl-tRNA formyltransferase, mitochondrial-like [Oopsacas minuta]